MFEFMMSFRSFIGLRPSDEMLNRGSDSLWT